MPVPGSDIVLANSIARGQILRRLVQDGDHRILVADKWQGEPVRIMAGDTILGTVVATTNFKRLR